MSGASVSGASDALGMGPSSGYSLNLVLVFLLSALYNIMNMPCLFMFDHEFVLYMLHDIISSLILLCHNILNHVHVTYLNHVYVFRLNILAVIEIMLIFTYIVIMMLLFSRVNLN